MSEEILKRYKIRAKKALGQNFLVNEDIIKSISEVIDTEDKNIIEVGPGYGALTQKLLEQNLESLTLVELDLNMVEILEDRIKLGELQTKNTNFEIQNIDILEFYINFNINKYSVIANIPYYITSPILRHFLYKLEKSPDEMVILMQKDVGDKILNIFKDKKSRSSVIGLMMAKKCFVTEEILVSPDNFVPAPNVESSVLKFIRHNLFQDIDDDDFLKLVKIGFSSSRKKLIKNFINGGFEKDKILEIFKNLDIDENIRAEAIGIEKWCELVQNITK